MKRSTLKDKDGTEDESGRRQIKTVGNALADEDELDQLSVSLTLD